MGFDMEGHQCDVCRQPARCAMINKDKSLRYSCLDQEHIREVWNRVNEE